MVYREDSEYKMCDTDETEICPFCKSKDIFSGSWSPETCRDCKATYFFGTWFKEKNNAPVV